MSERIRETRDALVFEIEKNVLLQHYAGLQVSNAARLVVNAVFELLGIEEVRAERYVPDDVSVDDDHAKEGLRFGVAHEIAKHAPTEVTVRPQSRYDSARGVRRLRASALAITKEVDQ